MDGFLKRRSKHRNQLNDLDFRILIILKIKQLTAQNLLFIVLKYHMSKSTTVNDFGFTPFANGGCQSLLQLTIMG